jgi:glycosyltransferase involved in cell wall biosynthesis
MVHTVKTVNGILTFSQTVKDAIENTYGIEPGKVAVVQPVLLKAVTNLDERGKQDIKDQYTEGREFFYYSGSLKDKENLILLLKAFSIFKKRQRSSWKLVLIYDEMNTTVEELLKTYKFKEDVVLVLNSNQKIELLASSYALVVIDSHEGFLQDVPPAMSLGVPVIAPQHSIAEERSRPAGLYFEAHIPESIAAALMTIYKDEARRNQMIDRGSGLVADWDKGRFLTDLWEKVVKAANA